MDSRLQYASERRPTDRWLSKDEANALLQVWRDENIPVTNLDFSLKCTHKITTGVENVILNLMCDKLYNRINTSAYDPITEVAGYYYEMEEILATSDDDHIITHRYASYLENAAHDLLGFFIKKEKEIIDNECKRMAR